MSPCAVAIAGVLSGIRFLLGFIHNAAGSPGLPELSSAALNLPFPRPVPLSSCSSMWAHNVGQSLLHAAELSFFFNPARSGLAVPAPLWLHQLHMQLLSKIIDPRAHIKG